MAPSTWGQPSAGMGELGEGIASSFRRYLLRSARWVRSARNPLVVFGAVLPHRYDIPKVYVRGVQDVAILTALLCEKHRRDRWP